MKGEVLYPLHQLRLKNPTAYEEEIKKYDGRKSVLEARVIPFDCLWNDVIHLTAVHPSKVRRALIKADFRPGKHKWFKINPYSLDRSKTTVFLYNGYQRGRSPEIEEFVDFNPHDLSKYNRIGPRTFAYFKEMKKKEIKPLMFHLVPHILHHGSLSIRDAEVIEA